MSEPPLASDASTNAYIEDVASMVAANELEAVRSWILRDGNDVNAHVLEVEDAPDLVPANNWCRGRATTLLYISMARGHTAMVELLLSAGADVLGVLLLKMTAYRVLHEDAGRGAEETARLRQAYFEELSSRAFAQAEKSPRR